MLHPRDNGTRLRRCRSPITGAETAVLSVKTRWGRCPPDCRKGDSRNPSCASEVDHVGPPQTPKSVAPATPVEADATIAWMQRVILLDVFASTGYNRWLPIVAPAMAAGYGEILQLSLAPRRRPAVVGWLIISHFDHATAHGHCLGNRRGGPACPPGRSMQDISPLGRTLQDITAQTGGPRPARNGCQQKVGNGRSTERALPSTLVLRYFDPVCIDISFGMDVKTTQFPTSWLSPRGIPLWMLSRCCVRRRNVKAQVAMFGYQPVIAAFFGNQLPDLVVAPWHSHCCTLSPLLRQHRPRRGTGAVQCHQGVRFSSLGHQAPLSGYPRVAFPLVDVVAVAAPPGHVHASAAVQALRCGCGREPSGMVVETPLSPISRHGCSAPLE